MPLRLRVISHQRHPLSQALEHLFDEQGGTIGRAAGNDFTLPDPERFVSSRHAVLSCREGIYFITDTSTNGVFINDTHEPLGHGNSARLDNGDRLSLGEYSLEVQVTPSSAKSPSPGQGPPNEAFFAGEEFPDLGGSVDSEGGELLGPEGPGSLLADLDHPESDCHRMPGDGPGAESRRPWEEHFRAPEMRPEPEGSETEAPASPPSQGNGAPLLPEDWDQPPEDESSEENPIPNPSISRASKTEEGPKRPSTAPVEAVASEEKDESTALPSGGTEDAQRLLQAFLSGAGLSRLEIPPEQASALMEQVGSILRAMVDGTMAVLRSRSSVKGEFRLAQTTIRPVENNPLKFSVNVDEALEHLLTPREESGYLPPLQATEEAYDDIKAHQLAVMAGMQAALKAVLERFDPAYLEQRLEKPSVLDSMLPVNRRAKSWERFTELYQEVAREAEDDFQRLFGEAFARTYEEQLRKLRSKSKR